MPRRDNENKYRFDMQVSASAMAKLHLTGTAVRHELR
jgi:hypothetical protein